jgi:hypothetical protein
MHEQLLHRICKTRAPGIHKSTNALAMGRQRRRGDGEADDRRSREQVIGGRAAPRAEDANNVFRTGCVDVGTGATEGVGADADTVSSSSAQDAVISSCAVPSRGEAGAMSCSAATAAGGDASMGRGPV